MISRRARKDRLGQSFRLLYRCPAFGWLWVDRLISSTGDEFTLLALPWFVLQVTGSGTATAGILLALQLLAILTSMGIGSLIDRFQSRAIITIDNGARTFIIGLIPILYWLGLLELWLLFLLNSLRYPPIPAHRHLGSSGRNCSLLRQSGGYYTNHREPNSVARILPQMTQTHFFWGNPICSPKQFPQLVP